MLDFTVDALLEAAREDAELPEWEDDEAPARLLATMNRLQRLQLAALLQKAKEQHRHATLDLDIEEGELRYDLPERAVAAGIVQAHLIDDSGELIETLTVFPASRRTERGAAGPGKAYLEGTELVLYAAPPGSGTLRITYNRRLSELVLEEDAGVITNVNTGTGVVTISAAPADFPLTSRAYDFVKAEPHFDIRAMDKAATRSGTSLTFAAADLPEGLANGDYVCLAGTTPVCQAPLELHPVLSLMTAYRWTKSKGDPAAASIKDDLANAMRDAMDILTPRIEAQPAVIINTNGPGWRRFGRGFRR